MNDSRALSALGVGDRDAVELDRRAGRQRRPHREREPRDARVELRDLGLGHRDALGLLGAGRLVEVARRGEEAAVVLERARRFAPASAPGSGSSAWLRAMSGQPAA
jgi:hypothetical protein